MRESLADFCHREHREELLAEWDTEKNLPLTPETVSRGSKHRVWWTCAHGHHWQAAVHTRSGSGTGCPYCTGRRPIPGETDLATRYPELARQWHPTKNGALTPSDVLPGSHQLVWWLCPNGHEWRAQVKSRVSGAGCPICTNRHVLSAITTSPPITPISPASGTQQRMAASPLMTSCPALIEKSGGSATKVTNGKLPSAPASAAAAAPSVQAKKLSPARTTSPVSIQTLPASGTQRKTAASPPSTSPPPATKKSGGSATKAMNTRPPSPAAPSGTAAAHTAPTPKCSPGITTLPPSIPT